MKKIWKYFMLFALLGALMCTAAFAVDEPTFTDVADGATFTLDASGEKFEVTYTGPTSGQYLILMVAAGDDGLYTITDESIQYVNQDAADASGVAFTVYPTAMVDAKIMLGGAADGPVTLGYLDMPAPDVTVNIVGSSNTAEATVSADGKTLNVQNDQACVVVYTTDGGETYQTLEATPNADGGYDYDLSGLPAGAEVSVAIKGDANGDGKVNNTDYAIIKKMLLNDTALSSWQSVMFDVNGDGKINNTDYAILKKHLLDTSKNLVNW